jgi:hypothetical protein
LGVAQLRGCRRRAPRGVTRKTDEGGTGSEAGYLADMPRFPFQDSPRGTIGGRSHSSSILRRQTRQRDGGAESLQRDFVSRGLSPERASVADSALRLCDPWIVDPPVPDSKAPWASVTWTSPTYSERLLNLSTSCEGRLWKSFRSHDTKDRVAVSLQNREGRARPRRRRFARVSCHRPVARRCARPRSCRAGLDPVP